MKLNSLKELFTEQLRDLYSAEKQLIKALPKLAKCATNEELKQGFLDHLEETQGQAKRLEKIFEGLDEKPNGKTCAAMKGLVEEGAEVLEAEGNPAVIDAALIAAARRVEHYEIAAYGVVSSFAKMLEMDEAVSLLQKTLDEESAADKNLMGLAESKINQEACDYREEEREEKKISSPKNSPKNKNKLERTGTHA